MWSLVSAISPPVIFLPHEWHFFTFEQTKNDGRHTRKKYETKHVSQGKIR